MPYVLGIDIGGTTTTAAISRLTSSGWSDPEVVRLGSRSRPVPSVLHLAADGALAVGEPVRLDPDRVLRGFVGRIGDDVPLVVGGEPCTPQALTAVLAMWVVERVAAREGAVPDQVVLSHPACWGRYRRALLHQALREIGSTNVTLLPEPVVAAESHAAGGWAGGTLAVYSLGASQFEAAVVGWTGGYGFRLLARAALAGPFGGDDIDEAMAEQVQAKLGEESREFRELRRAGPQARLALFGLRRECVRAKERLTTATETEVPVPLPHGQVVVPVSRAELSELVRPALQVTVDVLAKTVGSRGPAGQQLDGVLLVGGAARMPLVAELVAARVPGPVTVEREPRSIAATGAAVAAARIATPEWPLEPDPIGTGEPGGLGSPGGGPRTVAQEGERSAGPPPRPPVAVARLKLSGARPGQRRLGLVGGRR